jgi:hypothetical protein
VTTPQFPRPSEEPEWQPPSAVQPPYQPGQSTLARPSRKPHRARNIVLSAVGVITAIAVISSIASAGSKNHGGAPGPSSAGTTMSAPAATSPALSDSAQELVSNLQSSTLFNIGSSTSDAEIASYGQQVCSLRQAGQGQTAAISDTETTWSNMSPMLADAMTRLAEQDMCAGQLPEQTITYIVRGTPGAQVTYGPAGSDYNGTVPMKMTAHLGDPEYYAINAQLQGAGHVKCSIEVDGIPLSTASASGGYNIADCEIGQDPVTNLWENDNTG